jgi:AraC-like DNA-binding protein
MNVSVSPYFWKSWWFMAIVVIALLILAKYTYDKRIEVLRRREAERLLKPIEEALKNSEEPQQLQTRIENILENQHRIKASQIKSFEADSIELQSQERPFMERLTEVMEANYSNSEFGVAELSKELGISRSVLSKQIAAEIGESTSRFMCDYRLEVAKDILLKNPGNRNIAEIAFKVGFNDPKYFTRRFTKKFGSSPSTFKA